MLNAIKVLLEKFYKMDAVAIVEQRGGWSSRAFRIDTDGGRYFLKVYDKLRPATNKWTETVEAYTPLLGHLGKDVLKSRVSLPIATVNGSYLCEDEHAKYLLYDYIEGLTVGDVPLSREQVGMLGDLVGCLHHFKPSAVPEAICERFEVDFNKRLALFLASDIPAFIAKAIAPYTAALEQLVTLTNDLAESVRQIDVPCVLCHTDIQNWNLMQSGDQLVLIDWEGMKYAPHEADFFALMDLPFYDEFLTAYQMHHPAFELNETLLAFYKCRRKAEDIWEFIEQLLYEDLDANQQKGTLLALVEKCYTLTIYLEDPKSLVI